MELLYATGMRVSELVSLPVAAARGRPELLLIAGKGGKERMVPLSPPRRRRLRPGWRCATGPRRRAAPRARPPRLSCFPRGASPGI